MPMNRNAIIVGTLILTAGAVSGGDTFNPRALTPGSVVRIAARRPAINLGRAEVVACTTNVVTVRHKQDRFAVAASNVIEMAMIEKGPPLPEPDVAPGGTPAPPSDLETKASRKTGLWETIKGYWSKFRRS
jgi:hypothetical protein